MQSAVASQQAGTARKEAPASLARTLASLTKVDGDDLLARVPELFVSEFGAVRSELWLCSKDPPAEHPAHFAGLKNGGSPDLSALARGILRGAVQEHKRIESHSIGVYETSEAEFAAPLHVSAYPILSEDHVVAVLSGYSAGPVHPDLVPWWRLYAEICALKVPEVLRAGEQKHQITQLSLLFEATRLLNSTLDLAELLELILKIARQEVKAERGTMFLVDNHRRELWSIVATGLDRQEIRIPFGKGIAGRVAETGELVNVENAYTHPDFDSSFDHKFGYVTRSVLTMPIRHHTGEIVGVLQLLNRFGGGIFTPQELEFLEKLSGHMAMALENARLHRESLEKQRLQKELALARQIQMSLLPESPPAVPGYELAVQNEPCFEVGGDYYDFLNMGPGTLLLVIADVEGKGIASALVMSNLQATLRALVSHLHSLEVLTFSLNQMMCNDTKSRKYLSMFLALVDTNRKGLHYINAGHVPPILVDGASGDHRVLTEGGTLIGLFPRSEYTRGRVKLAPGDILVCCTDGILEACPSNNYDVEFGGERLASVVARNRHSSAEQIIASVLAEVNAFCGGNQTDDKVLMVMKVAEDGTLTSAAN